MIGKEHRERYFRLLGSYLEDPDERKLLEAADLGREFVRVQVPAEDLTELHEDANARLARERSKPELATVAAASQPFMEVMMAYGLEFRLQVEARLAAEKDLREANQELRHSVQELEIYKRVFQALPLGVSVFALRDLSNSSSLEFILGNPAAVMTSTRINPSTSDTNKAAAPNWKAEPASFSKSCAEVIRQGKPADLGVSVFEDEVSGESFLHTRAFPLPDNHVGLHIEDITERRTLEAKLRQAQKMEAVGRLAGGFAHDFNNVLTTIFSFAEFAAERVGTRSPAYQDIQEVLQSAERAAGITRQLLSFSRRQGSPRVFDLNSRLRNIDRMIRGLIDEDVEYHTRLSEGIWNIRMDPGALEQVVINLTINARDALSRRGVITLATENMTIREVSGHRDAALQAGEYVILSVTDNGIEMSDELQRRIFEPFFTTKESSKGTGLGLSICLDLVEQAGGAIRIDSRVNYGTTIRILIPRAREAAEELREERKLEKRSGFETILVAEDADGVRRSSCRALRECGYEVLSTASGIEALRICEARQVPPDLLLTDVVMPELGGRELASRVTRLFPEVKVLFMSGYTGDERATRDILKTGRPLLQKPFSIETLLRSVREVLDSKSEI